MPKTKKKKCNKFPIVDLGKKIFIGEHKKKTSAIAAVLIAVFLISGLVYPGFLKTRANSDITIAPDQDPLSVEYVPAVELDPIAFEDDFDEEFSGLIEETEKWRAYQGSQFNQEGGELIAPSGSFLLDSKPSIISNSGDDFFIETDFNIPCYRTGNLRFNFGVRDYDLDGFNTNDFFYTEVYLVADNPWNITDGYIRVQQNSSQKGIIDYENIVGTSISCDSNNKIKMHYYDDAGSKKADVYLNDVLILSDIAVEETYQDKMVSFYVDDVDDLAIDNFSSDLLYDPSISASYNMSGTGFRYEGDDFTEPLILLGEGATGTVYLDLIGGIVENEGGMISLPTSLPTGIAGHDIYAYLTTIIIPANFFGPGLPIEDDPINFTLYASAGPEDVKAFVEFVGAIFETEVKAFAKIFTAEGDGFTPVPMPIRSLGRIVINPPEQIECSMSISLGDGAINPPLLSLDIGGEFYLMDMAHLNYGGDLYVSPNGGDSGHLFVIADEGEEAGFRGRFVTGNGTAINSAEFGIDGVSNIDVALVRVPTGGGPTLYVAAYFVDSGNNRDEIINSFLSNGWQIDVIISDIFLATGGGEYAWNELALSDSSNICYSSSSAEILWAEDNGGGEPLTPPTYRPSEEDQDLEEISEDVDTVESSLLKSILDRIEALEKRIAELESKRPAPIKEEVEMIETVVPVNQKIYIVQPRDYLYLIAQKLYGDSNRWYDLVNLNRDRYPEIANSPYTIKIGWELRY